MRLLWIALSLWISAQWSRAQSPQDVAQQKANAQAAACKCHHPGGSMAGATHEGCGIASTPEQAVRVACYYGKLPLIASAVARGRNGYWFATNLYHAGGARAVVNPAPAVVQAAGPVVSWPQPMPGPTVTYHVQPALRAVRVCDQYGCRVIYR